MTETRNIYVGDIMAIEIASRDVEAEGLQELFSAFDVVGIKHLRDGYEVLLRTFETGEQRVTLGDKELIIQISSTLDDIQREGIFEGEAVVAVAPSQGLIFVPVGISAAIFIVVTGILLAQAVKKKKRKALSPYQFFLKRTAALSASTVQPPEDDFFVALTRYFKEYLGALHQRLIIGKTSGEIVSELKTIPALHPPLPEIETWLIECDRLKFTGITVENSQRDAHYQALLTLAAKINEDVS